MKKSITLLVASSVVIALTGCGAKSCDVCDEITGIQEELVELDSYITSSVDMEGSLEYDEKENRQKELIDQLEILLMHECPMPEEDVQDQEYVLLGKKGTYTGGWKSVMPLGEGTYTRTDSYGTGTYSVTYEGAWLAGVPDGNGTLTTVQTISGYTDPFTDVYTGGFKNGKFEGTGNYSLGLQDTTLIIENGTFENGQLVGSTDFEEYDKSGNLYDYGTVELVYSSADDTSGNYNKLYSARKEKEEEEARKAQEEYEKAAKDAIKDFGSYVWGVLTDPNNY